AFKMYANESKGEKFPSLKTRGSSGAYPAVCDIDNTRDFMFDGPGVYPEYLTDVNVMICPSDADGFQRLESGEWNGGAGGAVDPCAFGNISYAYFGWALVPAHYLLASGSGDNAPNAQIGVDIDTAWVNVASDTILVQGPSAYDGDMSFDATDDGPTTMYRLREGIERFFVSDINNPAATTKAQSELAVMYDTVQSPTNARGDSSFNHIPGGGNVLYMDGHVKFLRYPSEYPVSRSWAVLMDTFAATFS
ncbi:MAG: hypothetical protein GY851_00540, partial [bacterium]|nr:hypothetical protein [bacterium]